LIWYGDILYGYGVIGLLMFPLRKLTARALITAGVVIVTLHSLMNLGAMFGIAEMKQNAEKAAVLQKDSWTPEQKRAVKEWDALSEMFNPPKEEIDREVRAMRGNWLEVAKVRSAIATKFETEMFFQFLLLDVLGMLVLGMGLAKAGVFDASLSYRFYTVLSLAGFGFGIPLNYWAATQWIRTGLKVPEWFGYINATADPGRFAVAMGYTGLIMLICKSGSMHWLRAALASVGRTALSNYLLTSILCTLLFNGYGLGLFGKLERVELYWVVIGVWAVNLTVSPIWLRHFQYGPAEWAWRSLTYWERQPMRK
jgi:uncharacterized protein